MEKNDLERANNVCNFLNSNNCKFVVIPREYYIELYNTAHDLIKILDTKKEV